MQLLKQKSAIFNNSGSYSMIYNAYMYDFDKNTPKYTKYILYGTFGLLRRANPAPQKLGITYNLFNI